MAMVGDQLTSVCRRVARRPLIPAVVVATLAVGIAAVTAVFTVADTVLLQPLPLPDSGRIVRFYSTLPDAGAVSSVNYFDIRDVAATARSFSAVSPYQTGTTTWRADTGPEPLAIVRTGPGFMRVLGARPALGRDFADEDFAVGGPAVAIATDRFWRRLAIGHAGVDAAVVNLDGRLVRIVGVLPPMTFLFPDDVDLWVPLVIAPDSFLFNRQSVSLGAIGRVDGTASVAQASEELAAIIGGLRSEHPATSGRRSMEMRVLADTLSSAVRPTILLLATGVLGVLLVAAVNVADLLLSDAAARRHEFAIRAALGGDRRRLSIGVSLEACLLAGLGLGGALLLVPTMISALLSLYPTPLPRLAEIGLGPRGIAVALLATGVSATLMLWPLIRSTFRAESPAALRLGARTAGGTGRRLGRWLVAGQVALSIVLLVAGAQLTRTFLTASSAALGFEPQGVLTFHVAPPTSRYADATAAARFHVQMAEAIARIPSVTAVGSTQFLPFAAGNWGDNFRRVGTTDQAPNLPDAAIHIITPGLPEALGLPLRAGRAFAESDRAGAEPVVLVNEVLAARWLEGAPLGRQIEFNERVWRVVGVVGDKRQTTLVEPPGPELYFPWAQMGRAAGWLVVRVAGAPLEVLAAVKAAAHTVDPTVPLMRVDSMEARVARAMAPERFRATLATALGAVAVVLVILGLYGVLAHAVANRSREIGVRMALGATPASVGRQVLSEAIGLTAGGVVAGLVLTTLLGRWLQAFLVGDLQARDPLLLAGISAVLLAVAVIAAWIPARRASGIAPTVALRE